MGGHVTPVDKGAYLERTLRGECGAEFVACKTVPGRQQVASALHDGSLLVWPLAGARTRPLRLESHRPGPLTWVATSASGGLLAASSMDATVSIWRNQAGAQTPDTIKVHFSPVRACDISHDERLLASASDDRMVKLSSLTDCRCVASLVGHSNWVRSTVFSPSAHLVVSGGDDKTVRLWCTERKEALRVWYDCSDSVASVCFDCAGASVAACSSDSTIDIWDCRTQELRQHYGRAHGNSPITQVAFHPSQDILLSSSADNTLRLWDLRAGRLRSTIYGQEKPVKSCCWDDDGKHFISCDSRVISIWAFTNCSARRDSVDRESRAPARTGSHAPSPGLPVKLQKPVPASKNSEHSQAEMSASPASLPGKQLTSPLSSKTSITCVQTEGGALLNSTAYAKDLADIPALSGRTVPARDCSLEFVPAQRPDVLEAVGKTCEHLITQMDTVTTSLQAFELRLISLENATAEVARTMEAQRRIPTSVETSTSIIECKVSADIAPSEK